MVCVDGYCRVGSSVPCRRSLDCPTGVQRLDISAAVRVLRLPGLGRQASRGLCSTFRASDDRGTIISLFLS